MESTIKRITPEVAKAMLERNTENRSVRKAWVTYLARQMSGGHWKPTADGIAIRKDGVIMNGQHRLLAIVQSGVAVDLLVVTGFDKESFLVMDRGAGRTIADVTGFSNELVADANLILHTLNGHQRFTEEAVVDVVAWWSNAHNFCRRPGMAISKGCYSAPVRIGHGLRWATSERAADKEFVATQYRALLMGDTTVMTRATAGLWKRLVQTKPGLGHLKERLDLLTLVYHTSHPARQLSAVPKDPEAVLGEIKGWLGLMEEAFVNGTPTNPYRFLCWGKSTRPGFRIRRTVEETTQCSL
jgi:hypothetical protein